MKIEHDDLCAIWREPAGNDSSERSRCLTDHEWVRVLQKDADDAERERAAIHIASCSECADEYSLLLPLRAWLGRVEEAYSPAAAARADRWAAWRVWWTSRRLGLAAAAVILLLVTHGALMYQLLESQGERALLGAQLADQERAPAARRESQGRAPGIQTEPNQPKERIARLPTPDLVADIVDLEPRSEALVRGAADHQVIVTGRNATAVAILNHSPLATNSTLEVVVEGAGLEAPWRRRVQREQGSAAFAVMFPAEYPAGEYVIYLFDVTGRRSTLLGEYPVVIEPGEAPPR